MAGEKSDPYANTAAFRAFAADEPVRQQPARKAPPARRNSRPSPLVFWTAVVVLIAMVGAAVAVLL